MKLLSSLPGLALLGLLFSTTACNSDTTVKSGETPPTEFDRTEFLTHYAQDLIAPSFATLLTKLDEMEDRLQAFQASTNSDNLRALQKDWTAVYRAWLRVNGFNFGPGGKSGLVRTLTDELGVFPVDVATIEARVTSGEFDFEDSERQARGLLAIEYLLFRNGDEANTLASFDQNRLAYLEGAFGVVKKRIQRVSDDWNGAYATEFIQSKGTDVSSATTQLFNEWARSFETIKDLKLAAPMGIVAGQYGVKPELVEAFYSKQSVAFLRHHFDAVVALWYGQPGEEQAQLGWDDYLRSVEGGSDLVAATETQIQAVYSAFANLPPDRSLQDLITAEDPKLATLHLQIQELSRFFKTDLSSLLGLAVTFSTSDG
ncbi:MAG: imelysin family protein, partial [Bacteroidota bacterium]